MTTLAPAIASLQQYSIMVPQQYNNGQDVDFPTREIVEVHLLQAYGGYTTIPGLQGAWSDDTGHIYRDNLTQYLVALPVERAQERVVDSAIYIGRLLGQHAMYVMVPQGQSFIVTVE